MIDAPAAGADAVLTRGPSLSGSPINHRTYLGARYLGEGRTLFRVWSPTTEGMQLHLIEPVDRRVPMERDANGYHVAIVEDVGPGALYKYVLDSGDERPDPASRGQPQGVHGPSEIQEPNFAWTDDGWAGLALRNYIIYELHVGTFTREGTFEAIIPYLEGVKELGVTAIELMPIAQNPGDRNWGYDGVYLYAAQCSYGGVQGLKRLVNAAHNLGLAVVLDCVYNHLGPEGNYLGNFAPYFTDRYKSPWGSAVNVDGPGSDEVRHFFTENALWWIDECHVDALRLDAIDTIIDINPRPFIYELTEAVDERATGLNRLVQLFAETSLNDPRLLRPRESGGLGMPCQWTDDFHHALRTLLTPQRSGYYADYGRLQHLAKSFRGGYVYTGEFSRHWERRRGASSDGIPGERFLVCSQNHDQVGNRPLGDRLTQQVDFESLKLAAAAVLLSPFIPLLFMGEEYGETNPFPYFIDHGDEQLRQAVREGRLREFMAFMKEGTPLDPSELSTFEAAKLNRELAKQEPNRALFAWYQALIAQRKAHPALSRLSRDHQEIVEYEREQALLVRRWTGDAGDADRECVMVLHFGTEPASLVLPLPGGDWLPLLDSADARWQGPGTTLGEPQGERITSGGEVTLKVLPRSAILLDRVA